MRADSVESTADADSLRIDRSHLEQLQRMAGVGAVASSIAHEFNNILTTILNQAKHGGTAVDLDSKQKAFERILTAARRAARVTTGVLALSRSRSGKKEWMPVVPMVEEVLAVLEKDLSKHRIRLERHFSDQPVAEAIPTQIEQVLMNLVINARQAMPRGGHMRVSVSFNPASAHAEIGVQDSGCGIPPEMLGRIFDPFFTTKDGPDESGQGGSGLGLSICREIIERHHGRIRVESVVGRGTTFILKLPGRLAAAPAAAA
ncbi:MAG TPA: ATP-binding protein [Planctomycetia bacterium]|nr:ATP-binding protein [Planctomycetia bacterium]